MEILSFTSKFCFNTEETNNEVSQMSKELEIIIGNNDSSDSINKQKITETTPSHIKTVPILIELEKNNFFDNPFGYNNNEFNFFERNFTKFETTDINSLEYNPDFLQSTSSFSFPSDLNVNENFTDTEMLSESLKTNPMERKSKISKRDNDKDHCRKYREKNKKNLNILEQELAKKTKLNDRLTKKINLLNNLIELFKCISSFKKD